MRVGEKIPDFTLPATTGEPLTLSLLAEGKRAVVLTTFPLAFSGG